MVAYVDLRSLGYFVAVAEELNVGRAATRLHMAQPPLSRAIKALEDDLGAELFTRTPRGVSLTQAGHALLPEAREVLARVDSLRSLVTQASDARILTIGTLADSMDHAGRAMIDTFRQRNPAVEIRIVEGDLTDPTVGVDRGLADVAITRGPFTASGIAVAELRRDEVGVVLRETDPLAARARLQLSDLRDRRWFRLPESADPLWRDYWAGGSKPRDDDDTIIRTARECLHAVLWSDAIGLAPLSINHPHGIVVIPVDGIAPSPLLVAWRRRERRTLVHDFVDIAARGVLRLTTP